MSAEVDFTFHVNAENIEGLYSSKGPNVEIRSKSGDDIWNMAQFTTGSEERITFNDTAKSHWFPNSTAHPIRIYLEIAARKGTWIPGTGYAYAYLDDVKVIEISGGQSLFTGTYQTDEQTYGGKLPWTKQSVIEAAGRGTSGAVAFYRYFILSMTFVRYDFSAQAGKGILSASCTPNGYDGDAITYTATVKGGYVFDGWYNGNIKVGSNPIHVQYVNGTDVTLTAKARPTIQIEVNDSLRDGTSEIIKVDGHWRNLTSLQAISRRTFLYNRGDECTTVTGGWVASAYVSDYDYGMGFRGETPTLLKTESPMVLFLGAGADSHSAGVARTGKSVDITGFTTINAHFTNAAVLNGFNASARIHLVQNNQDRFLSAKEITVINSWSGDWDKQDFTVRCNINDLSGEFFVYLYVACSAGADIIVEADKIWLE